MSDRPEGDRVSVRIIEDPDNSDELMLDLGFELCDRLGWSVGDKIEWIDNKDGSWTLKRIHN